MEKESKPNTSSNILPNSVSILPLKEQWIQHILDQVIFANTILTRFQLRLTVRRFCRRIAVTQEQIHQYNLPTVPAKKSETRRTKWLENHANGDDRTTDLDAFVALDHTDQRKPFRKLLQESVEEYFDNDIYRQLKNQDRECKSIRRIVNKKVKFLELEESK